MFCLMISWYVLCIETCTQLQIEEAINLEDFEKAGRIKKKLAAVKSEDLVAGAMSDYKVHHFTACLVCFVLFSDVSCLNIVLQFLTHS